MPFNPSAMYFGMKVKSHRIGVDEFILPERYKPHKKVGSGAYGNVVEAVDLVGHQKVAIKKVKEVFKDAVDAKRILREVLMLQHLNHPNICKIIDLCPPASYDSFEDMYFVLEYMETDLHHIIYSSNVLSINHIAYFIYQVLKGLKYCHGAGIVHRDLKPGNLLINSDCTVKICDFGLATHIKDGEYFETEDKRTSYVVTRWYRAPEIMCCEEFYEYKIDVWSVGCILAELIRRRPLFPGDDYIQQLTMIFKLVGVPNLGRCSWINNRNVVAFIQRKQHLRSKNFREVFSNAPDLACDLLKKMLVFNPPDRISVDEALEHPFFAEYHDPSTALPCSRKYCQKYEKNLDDQDSGKVKALMYDAIIDFHQKIANKPEH